MFVLTHFEDNSFYICTKKNVTYVQGSRCIVKYKNGGRYHAEIIAENAERRVLEEIQAKKCNEISMEDDNNEFTDQAEETKVLSLQNTPVSQCHEHCHLNDTYTINDKETHSITYEVGNNSVLINLLEEIAPTDMAGDASFTVTDFLTESIIGAEISTSMNLLNSTTNVTNFSTILTEPVIFSTPIEGTDIEPGLSSDIPVSEQSKKTSLEPRCLQYSSPEDEYASSIRDDSKDSDFQPSQMDSDALLEKNTFSVNSTYTQAVEPEMKKNPENGCPKINMPGKSTRDDSEMFVRTAAGKKAQDRRSYCMFCQTMQSKFVRHLENKHKDVDIVKKFSTLPKGNPDRLNIIDDIRKKCMFDYNTNNHVNDGELLVCRRPSAHAPRPASHFVVCENCSGFFSKHNIRHHVKRCFSHDGKLNRKLLVRSRQILGRIHAEACEILRKDIFPILREDDVVRLIRYDRLIILYGNKLCAKHGNLQHQHDMIRADLRLMGRFLQSVKLINEEITDFASVYRPRFYDDVILAVRNVGGFNPKTKKYTAPSTAYAIGSILKKAAHCYICDCIKREDAVKKGCVEDFLKLLEVDLGTDINKAVMESQTEQRRRKKIELPLISDIQKLNNYLQTEREASLQALASKFTYGAWLQLAETTLIAMQLFNRRRAGEVERVFIEDFNNHECIRDEELKNMSLESQSIAQNYVRFTIRGKLNRTVPVLLSAELTNSIRTILKRREEAGVTSENPYVFGLPGVDTVRFKHLRACVLLRKFASESKVDFPYKLTGTTLRKHVATACINLNLSQNEVADVAQFMGHAEKIHRSHYRQPIVSREILKMSKILEMAQRNPIEDDADSESDDERGIEVLNAETNNLQTVNAMMESTASTSKSGNKKRSTSPYGRVGAKKRWSIDEKNAASLLYGNYISTGTYPSLKEIQEDCSRHPLLQARNPCIIKTWISNQIKKKGK